VNKGAREVRKVVAAEYVSVDGVMQDPGWTPAYWNDELATYQSDQLFASDALLLLAQTRTTSTGIAVLTYSNKRQSGKSDPRRARLTAADRTGFGRTNWPVAAQR
jgi:hypothetical protein